MQPKIEMYKVKYVDTIKCEKCHVALPCSGVTIKSLK